jgi:hypothetical protein
LATKRKAEEEGYILLSRRFHKSDDWTSKRTFSKAEAWVDMLFLASFADHYYDIQGENVPLKRGQFVFSQMKLAKRWGWTRSKIRVHFEALKAANQIATQTANGVTMVTICNYDSYQPQQPGKQPRRQPAQQPLNNEGNRNNEGNKEEVADWHRFPKDDFPYLNDSEFVNKLIVFREMRRQIKKPIRTVTGAKQLLTKLHKYDLGTSLQALENSIAGEWQGVFPERAKPQGGRHAADQRRHEKAGREHAENLEL